MQLGGVDVQLWPGRMPALDYMWHRIMSVRCVGEARVEEKDMTDKRSYKPDAVVRLQLGRFLQLCHNCIDLFIIISLLLLGRL